MLLCAESVIFCTSHFTLLLIYRSCMYSSIFFTGTGKTATFSISILQQIDTSNHECQALILAPTRELAQQVFENAYFACFLLTYVEFFFFFHGVCDASIHRIWNCELWNHMCRFYSYLLLYWEGGGHAVTHLNWLVAWCGGVCGARLPGPRMLCCCTPYRFAYLYGMPAL